MIANKFHFESQGWWEIWLGGKPSGWETALGMTKGMGFLRVWGSQHYSPPKGLYDSNNFLL